MPLILVTFLAAFSIEALATVISVIGLSLLFGSNPIIIALAVALDMGKLVVVSIAYTYWRQLKGLMKAYALSAALITMVITSAGAAGYLSAAFQTAIVGTQEVGLKVDLLKQEQAKLEVRKKQIDDSIAQLPEKFSAAQRIRMINAFKEEQKQVTARLGEIAKQLPTLQVDQINVEAKAGPILYISKAFNIPVESAVKWVILLIVFVFDPLAVYLIICGNFLLHQRRVKKGTSVAAADLFAEEAKTPNATTVAAMEEARAIEPEEPEVFKPVPVTLVGVEDVPPTTIEPITLPEPPAMTEPPKSRFIVRPKPKAVPRKMTVDHAVAPAPEPAAPEVKTSTDPHTSTLDAVPVDNSVELADPTQIPTNSSTRSQYK